MFFRRPIFLNQLPRDASLSLARLTGLNGIARSVLVGVLPLIALKAFGDKEVIASVYFASTIITLLFTVNLASLENWLRRRWLFTLGGLMLGISVLLFYTTQSALFGLGVGLRAASGSIVSVCMSLYIMDYIGKKELTRNESRRMMYTAGAWLIGPALGSWIFQNSRQEVIFIISFVAAAAGLAYFWRLRLGDDLVIQRAQSKPKSPLKAIVRYLSQRRLRIAYMITLSRACFWVTLFVYGPIYVVEAGLPAVWGGLLLSGISGLLFISPIIQRLADRYGTRQVIMTCLVLIGTCLIGLGLLQAPKPIGLLFWVIGSLGASGVDILGNIPFMRMVRPRERSEMTMVFTTWREASSLLTQALVFLIVLIWPFWVIYFVLAAMQFLAAFSTANLPRRL
jgi:MFS family permease